MPTFLRRTLTRPWAAALAAATVLAAFFIHLALNKDRALTRQEAATLVYSSWMPGSPAGVCRFAATKDHHPPLYYLLLNRFMTHVTTDLGHLRALHIALFMPGVAAVTWLLARRASLGAALLAAAWMASGAYPAFLSGLCRQYGLMAALAAVYLLLLVQTPRLGRSGLAALALTAASLALTQYLAAFLFAASTVLLLTLGRGTGDPRPAGRWLVGHAGAALLVLPWLILLFTSERPTFGASYGGAGAKELWLEFLRIPCRFFFMGLRAHGPVLLGTVVLLLTAVFAAFLLEAVRALRKDPRLPDPGDRLLVSAAGLFTVAYLGILAYSILGRLTVGLHYFGIFYPPVVVGAAWVLGGPKAGRIRMTLGVLLTGIGAWTAAAAPPIPATEGHHLAALVGSGLKDGDLVLTPQLDETEAPFCFEAWIRDRRRIGILPREPVGYCLAPPTALPPITDPTALAAWMRARLDAGGSVWWAARREDAASATACAALTATLRTEVLEADENPWRVWRFRRKD